MDIFKLLLVMKGREWKWILPGAGLPLFHSNYINHLIFDVGINIFEELPVRGV